MLAMLLPLLVGLVAPSPVPMVNASAPSPLKEIGSVEARTACSVVVVRANSAISQALTDDAQLALAINRLRTTDLDSTNVITVRNGMADLQTLAWRLRGGAAAGDAATRQLRSIVAQTVDPQRKAELKAFTDALSGALSRQRKAGVDLDRMLVIIDGRRARQDVETTIADGVGNRVLMPENALQEPHPRATGLIESSSASTAYEPVDPTLRAVADEFETRAQAIQSDEGVAADHALGATAGC